MESLWRATAAPQHTSQRLEGEAHTDVLIVGGGMAGILCAYVLKESGVDCMVVERNTIGHGATGNTTAKITAQHGLIYASLLKKMGREKARLYYDANIRALTAFKELAQFFPCDLEEKDAFIYSSKSRKKLEQEAEAYEQLGIPGTLMQEVPIPVRHKAALRMDNQAQFHPLKFLYGLATQLPIYEQTLVTKIKDGTAYLGHEQDPKKETGRIRAKRILLCTHYPLINIPGLYFMKLNQERSYVVAVENGDQINGMYLAADKGGYSLRNYGPYLLIGGGNHLTGKKGEGYVAPRELASRAYPRNAQPYAWATQDCLSLDHVPYIGRFRKGKNQVYMASGFNKWGMTSSMLSAMVLRDLLLGGKSDYEDLFLPTRSMLHAKLFSNMLHSAMGMIGFRKRCSHMGCALRWNEQEGSWDCPCHGSRYDGKSGHVLDTPAIKAIKPH